MRAKRKKRSRANKNEGAQVSNELRLEHGLESRRSYGGEFRVTGADGVRYYETETESPSSTNPQ
jgi:hypothetical protein